MWWERGGWGGIFNSLNNDPPMQCYNCSSPGPPPPHPPLTICPIPTYSMIYQSTPITRRSFYHTPYKILYYRVFSMLANDCPGIPIPSPNNGNWAKPIYPQYKHGQQQSSYKNTPAFGLYGHHSKKQMSVFCCCQAPTITQLHAPLQQSGRSVFGDSHPTKPHSMFKKFAVQKASTTPPPLVK